MNSGQRSDCSNSFQRWKTTPFTGRWIHSIRRTELFLSALFMIRHLIHQHADLHGPVCNPFWNSPHRVTKHKPQEAANCNETIIITVAEQLVQDPLPAPDGNSNHYCRLLEWDPGFWPQDPDTNLKIYDKLPAKEANLLLHLVREVSPALGTLCYLWKMVFELLRASDNGFSHLKLLGIMTFSFLVFFSEQFCWSSFFRSWKRLLYLSILRHLDFH